MGCDANTTMNNRFGNDKPFILTDTKGYKYLARHDIGGFYTLEPLPEDK